MPRKRITGHQRRQIAQEIRHRMEGGEPFNFPHLSYKQLKEILRSAPGQPVFVSEGPKRPEDKSGTD